MRLVIIDWARHILMFIHGYQFISYLPQMFDYFKYSNCQFKDYLVPYK